MAENNRPFGQGFEDFLKEKGKAVIENPTVRSVAGGAKDLLFDYVIDPLAEGTTRVSSYRPAGLPSILDIMSPKTPPGSYEDVKSITENPTDKRKKLEPYVYNPNVTPLERLGMQRDRTVAEIKYFFDKQFGGAHRAGIKMLQDGVAFDDLPPELKDGTYKYLYGIGALVPLGKPIKAAQAVGQTSKQIAKDVGNVVTKKDSGFRLSAGGEGLDTATDLTSASILANRAKSLETKNPIYAPIMQVSKQQGKGKGLGTLEGEKYGNKEFIKYQVGDYDEAFNIVQSLPEFQIGANATKKQFNDAGKIYAQIVNSNDDVLKVALNNFYDTGTYGTVGYKIRKAALSDINDSKAWTQFGQQHPLRKGNSLSKARRLNKAIALIEDYKKNNPNSSGIEINFNKLEEILGDHKEYSAVFREATPESLEKLRKSKGSTFKNATDAELKSLFVQQKYQGEFQAIQQYLNDTKMPLARAFSLRKGAKGTDKRVKLNLNPTQQADFVAKRNEINKAIDNIQDVPIRGEVAKDWLRMTTERMRANYMNEAQIMKQVNNIDANKLAQLLLKREKANMIAKNFEDEYKDIAKVFGGDFDPQMVEFQIGHIKALEDSINTSLDMENLMIQTARSNQLDNDVRNYVKGKINQINEKMQAGVTQENVKGLTDLIDDLKQIDEIAANEGVLTNIKGMTFGDKSLQKSKSVFSGDEELFMADGGLVGDMIPVKAATGFFARLFGKPPLFRKEGMDVQDITTPTKKQQATLESLYPGVAFPETYPGEVFFSNLELSLAKRDAPKLFATDKEFYDYINRQGVGVDELDDAKVSNYVIQRAKEGQPILSDDVISIAQQSPLRNIYIDAYGFRSDKINIAPKNKFDRTGALVQTAGQGVSKSPSYSNTGLKDGYIEGSYRERVLRLPKDSLRGDPGTIPGGRSPHTFGRDVGDENGVYTIGWTRQTDRPAFILPGQTVNKETGEIIIPPQVADRTQLTNIEDKITKLFEDPITNLRLVDGQFDPDQAALVTQQVNSLVEKTGGKIDADKAYTILLTQAKQKQNQIKKLQNDYNTEKDRLDNFVPASRLDVTATVIDEAQSDIMQNANRKARELALRLDVMAENNIPLDQVRDKELLEYFKQTGGIARPVGKTKEELKSQFEELKRFNEILKNLSETPPYAITPTAINSYRDQIKNRQTAIIDEMAENISKDLMEQLYPDVPLKDRVQYLDALFKQSVAEAAYRKFIEKDPNAPNFIGVMGGKQVTSSYSQEGSTSTAPEIIADDKKLRIKNFKRKIEAGEETATIEPSRFPGVGTYEFYGGPEATDAAGKHYTGAAESIMNKIAQEYGSKLQILNVSTGQMRRSEVYNIVDQDTGGVVGTGETYRQAESIANDLVDNQGGRYRIQRGQSQSFESEPIYGFELTPQMLQLFKIYK